MIDRTTPPERAWLSQDDGCQWEKGEWDTTQWDDTVEYVRADRIAQLERERDEARDQCGAAMLALGVYETIRGESEGVVGWHLNGTVAAWSEFDIPDVPMIDALGPEADDEALRERVAFAMWREDAAEGTPRSVWENRTPDAFANAGDLARSKWLRFADAAIRVMRGDQ